MLGHFEVEESSERNASVAKMEVCTTTKDSCELICLNLLGNIFSIQRHLRLLSNYKQFKLIVYKVKLFNVKFNKECLA